HKNINYEYLYGINSVYSLITRNTGNRKIYEIILNKKRKINSKMQSIISEAKKKNIGTLELEPGQFNRISGENIYSQGICARVSPYNYCDLNKYLNKEANKKSKLIVLDCVTDVGNFGSIMRNCNAFGFEGVIIPKRRSVALNERVSRISAGALEEIKIFRVVNIVRILKKLK
ncbi:unnamed protein product, partial [marine sediment metagenome]